MLNLGGRPVIDRVVQRLRLVSELDAIVVATSTLDEEAPLLEHLSSRDVQVFRGSPTDVLSRYTGAARASGADVVVRVTSDCPLLSPSVTGSVIRRYLSEPSSIDYVSNTVERSFPRGLDTEVFSLRSLMIADAEAHEPPEREHVTPYIWRHPERFRIAQVVDEMDRSRMRWTLDTPDDYAFLQHVYGAMPERDAVPDFNEVLALLAAHPDWESLNSHVRQKRYGE